MGTPIKPGQIREGDRIRISYEYVALLGADGDGTGGAPHAGVEYELVSRPKVLPTRPGAYQGDGLPVEKGYAAFTLDPSGNWYMNGEERAPEFVKRYAPLAELRLEFEVASEVLAEVHGLFGTPATVHAEIDQIARRWATK